MLHGNKKNNNKKIFTYLTVVLRVPWTGRRSNQSILKGNQSWIFIRRTDTEAPIKKKMLHGKLSIRLGENSSWISDVQYNNAQKWDPPYREFRIHWCPQVIFLNRQYCFLGWGYKKWGLPWWLNGKESTCQCRRCRFNPWIRKIPSRRKRHPTLPFQPGKSHG